MAKNLSPRQGQEGICRCHEAEAIYIRTRNSNCNTTILGLEHLPDGFFVKTITDSCLTLLQIKSPESKKPIKPSNFICDPNFYVKLENNSLVLNPNGYFSQNSVSNGII